MSQIHVEIRRLAKAYGFPLCRITRPEINDANRHALLAWLHDGMYADMEWMSEETRLQRRLNPTSMLESVQSVIVLGFPYQPPPIEEEGENHAYGLIASYALGDDYHDVMKKKMRQFCKELETLLPQLTSEDAIPDQRIFVDTAPVLEHALAEAAGLGWLGKHSLSIDRQYGSYFFLAEIFITTALPVDNPVSAHCGSCIACLHACPTDAIVAPKRVDARRCISWLTIEFKGFIPTELRTKIGLHIYGCDDCQSCCPWNRQLPSDIEYLLEARAENILPRLADLLQLDDQGFRQRFRKSPIKRTGRARFVRNVCIAAGNSRDSRLTLQLITLLQDDEPLIRGHAAWALAQVTTDQQVHEVRQQLSFAGKIEQHTQVQLEITSACEYLRSTTS